MDFDFNTLAIGGVALAAFVLAQVEFFKNLLGWEGKKVTGLSMGLGVFWAAVFQSFQYVPEEFQPFVAIAVGALGFGLSASGYYKFATRNG